MSATHSTAETIGSTGLNGVRKLRRMSGRFQRRTGTAIDTTNGQITMVAAGRKQKAWFYDGLFKFRQTRGRRPLTTLSLTAKLACPKGNSAYTAAKRKRRRLWGDGKGRFRTQGSFSSATVRGTKWLTEDRCDGTLTRVKKGTVTVRDFARKRTVILRAGQRYLAKRK